MRDLDRQATEALAKIAEVLACEQCRRHDDGDLFALDRGGEGGAQRDFGLAEPNVAAHETIHRAAGGKVLQCRVNRAELILRLVVGKARAELLVGAMRRHELGRRFKRALRGQSDQPLRDLADALAHPCFTILPSRAAESVEVSLAIRLLAVARQEIEVFDRNEQFVAARVMQFEAIVRDTKRRNLRERDEASDAMIGMHHEIARRQRGDVAQHVLGLGTALARAHKTVAENVLFTDDRDVAGDEPAFDREHRERHASGAQRLRQRGDGFESLQPMFAEHMAKPLARAVRPASDDGAHAVLAQRFNMLDGRVEDVGALGVPFGREIAADTSVAVDDRLARRLRRIERGHAHQRAGVEPFAPLGRRQIECVGRQRFIDSGAFVDVELFLTGVEVVLHLRQAFAGGVFREIVEEQRRAVGIVEQRTHRAMKQREPMLHAGMPTALAHRFDKADRPMSARRTSAT